MAYLNVIITIEVLSRQNWSSKVPSDLFSSVGITVNNRYTLSIVLYAVVRYFIYVLRTMRRVSIFKPSTCSTRNPIMAKSLLLVACRRWKLLDVSYKTAFSRKSVILSVRWFIVDTHIIHTKFLHTKSRPFPCQAFSTKLYISLRGKLQWNNHQYFYIKAVQAKK